MNLHACFTCEAAAIFIFELAAEGFGSALLGTGLPRGLLASAAQTQHGAAQKNTKSEIRCSDVEP